MAKHPEIKVIVADVDGTLLDSKHKLADQTVDALKSAIEQGIQVILATGKTRVSSEGIYKRLGVETPGVFVQGMVLNYPDGTEKHLGALDADLLRRVITFAEDRGFQIVAYSGRRVLARRQTEVTIILTESYDEPTPEIVGPLQNIVDTVPINKLMFCGATPKQITHLRWQLEQMISGQARLTQALPEAVEMLPHGASKASALKVLFKELNIDPATVLAIGDGENDVEMIQLAGWGVAMGQGHPKLKAAAKAIVSTNDEHGVVEAVTKYVLKTAPSEEKVLVVESETPAVVEAVIEAAAEAATEVAEAAKEPAAKKKGASK